MLGILCGLESEAVIALQVKGAIVACAAARPEKARALARDLVAKGATRLMSFGIAGGLHNDMKLGSLVIGTKVVSPRGTWQCDAAWGDDLARKLPYAVRGAVWGSETLIAKATQKKELHDKNACVIVDMESQCAAEAAAELNVPLMVVRSVCDHADMDVPDIVMATIKDDGSVDYVKAITHVLRHPSHIPDLVHVGQGTGMALKALKKALIKLS